MKRNVFFIVLLGLITISTSAQACLKKLCCCFKKRPQNAVHRIAAVPAQNAAAAHVGAGHGAAANPRAVYHGAGAAADNKAGENQREESESSVWEYDSKAITLTEFEPRETPITPSVRAGFEEIRQRTGVSSDIHIEGNQEVNITVYNHPTVLSLLVTPEKLAQWQRKEAEKLHQIAREHAEHLAVLNWLKDDAFRKDQAEEAYLRQELRVTEDALAGYPKGGAIRKVLSDEIADLKARIEALQRNRRAMIPSAPKHATAGPGALPGHVSVKDPELSQGDEFSITRPSDIATTVPMPESDAALGAGAH